MVFCITVPSQPRNFRTTLVTANSIRFTWDEPAADGVNDRQIITYILSYKCSDSQTMVRMGGCDVDSRCCSETASSLLVALPNDLKPKISL